MQPIDFSLQLSDSLELNLQVDAVLIDGFLQRADVALEILLDPRHDADFPSEFSSRSA
jgi:hypothetical protein